MLATNRHVRFGGSVTFGWDTGGRLTSRSEGGTDSFGWDAENRLITALLDDGTEIRTTYDADGNRVRTEIARCVRLHSVVHGGARA